MHADNSGASDEGGINIGFKGGGEVHWHFMRALGDWYTLFFMQVVMISHLLSSRI